MKPLRAPRSTRWQGVRTIWDCLRGILRELDFSARPTRHAVQHAGVSWQKSRTRYLRSMEKDEHLQRHLDLCRRVYLRMLAEGSWPWKEKPDSTESDDVLESEDISDDV